MTIRSSHLNEISEKLRGDGLCLRTGPFSVRVQSNIQSVAECIHLLYQHHPMQNLEFCDYHLAITQPSGLRRWFRPQINFEVDGMIPFKPMPLDQAYATFEWGYNYCISSYAHQFLIIHAAVVEKHGFAMIMPAQPGSGKSTLTAALASKGWRLLSDELTLIPIENADTVVPLARPINLKNASIDVMREYAPEEIFGPTVSDTAKGTVTHMRAPISSIDRMDEPAQQKLIVFPQYHRNSATQIKPRSKARAFMEIAEQSFNFNIHGKTGFDILNATISNCDCYDFRYSNLDEAIELFDQLIEQQHYSKESARLAESST